MGCENNIYTVEGYHGDIDVLVDIKNKELTNIEILNSNETKEVVSEPVGFLIEDIIRYQSINVDTMSGATKTCDAIKEAVKLAAEKHKIDDIEKLVIKKVEENKSVQIETDVVVIGSGGAGLSAAIMAARNGSKVLVVEKMSEIGGNTYRATAMYNCVDQKLQEPLGIYDSEKIFFEETYYGGREKAKKELVEILTSQADEGKEFLEELGVEFQDVIDNCLGGSHARGHFSKSANGSDYIDSLKDECDKLGVEFLLNCEAKHLKTSNGEVVGVEAVNKTKNVDIKAKQGVVLATGGFGNNLDMRMKYDSTLTGELLCSNTSGTTGDGIIMAEEVNASLINMEYIECYPMADIKDGGLRNSIPNAINQGILVNQNGNRFIREDAPRDELANAIRGQIGGYALSIVDKDFSKQIKDIEFVNGLIYMGDVIKADSLEELAKRCNIDQDAFLKTIEEYNRGIDINFDNLGRKTNINKIDNPPYYANYNTISVHHTLGGVEINEKAQVIDNNGEVIKRLYAAGEVTGGIHGANRLGGNSFPDIIVFGRIAGENVSKEISNY